MRILISGGNGYVGRELCRAAMGEHELCVVDTLVCGYNRFSEQERSGLRLERVDITDAGAVAGVVADFQPQAMVHLAATHFIPLCEREPSKAVATNVLGTVSLLDACPAGCRFVFASSGAVYAPSDEALHEERSALAPQDVYGLTKLHGERYVRHFAARGDFPAAVVRLFNVIGPGETNPHVLPEILAQLKGGRRTLHMGNIHPERDYIDVRDAAGGFLAAATTGAIAGGACSTVNLGTGREYSVGALLDRLRDISGVPFEIKTDPARVRAVDRPHLRADRGRVAELFGWTPRHDIDETLRLTWEDPDLPPDLVKRYAAGS
jgi:UDP-glucose 4-epimerase